MSRQPFLHDLLVCLQAPTQAWSAPDGQIRGVGVQGVLHADVRVLCRAELTVGGEEPEVVAAGPRGAGAVHVVATARAVDGPGADPTTRVARQRTVTAGAVSEEVALSNATAEPVTAVVALTLASDMAPMEAIKQGLTQPTLAASATGDLTWTGPEGITLTVTAPGAQVDRTDLAAPVLRWQLQVPAGEEVTVRWAAAVTDPGGVVRPAGNREPEWARPTVTSADQRLVALVEQSLADLAGLRMSSTLAPGATFLAAGAPWFFTLFGRDSLWAARLMLPLGTELAAGTLRTLAAVQGTRVDPATAEQPGKILHEVRRAALAVDETTVLPPVYYGTIDATALWICLLHDAWRWGLAQDVVTELLPHLEAALEWLAEHGDADGDGFLEYLDLTGTGLANQGWKDSGDSVQWQDGSLAEGTIALCEVQGYAYEAAIGGAALLEAFGRPGADRWRAWAAGLAERFRAAFWVTDAHGRFPAIALDGQKRPVDSLTSNIGHLLGTGLLDAAEEQTVVERLRGSDMDSGFGLRTLSATAGGYWPWRYHGGSVWPHDTAIVAWGMARAGHPAAAADLLQGLVRAAPHFGYRLPELFSGDRPEDVPTAVPYPAACRPQAWSAAAAVAVLTTTLGLEADVPGGTLRVRPAPGRALRVSGLRLAGHELDVEVSAEGLRVSTEAPVTLTE